MKKKLVLALFFCFTASFVFANKQKTVLENRYDYIIYVDFQSAQLHLLNEFWENIYLCSVALPRNNDNFSFPVYGEVRLVTHHPIWYPTQESKNTYKKLHNEDLPSFISYGDKRNAMGNGKIIIDFIIGKTKNFSRIHGTNDEKSIGKRVSSGCIRLCNRDITVIINTINNKKTLVIYR